MVYRATTRGLIEGVISGFNATVFAYGPTGKRTGSALNETHYWEIVSSHHQFVTNKHSGFSSGSCGENIRVALMGA